MSSVSNAFFDIASSLESVKTNATPEKATKKSPKEPKLP